MKRAHYLAIARRRKSMPTGRSFRSAPMIPEQAIIRVRDFMSEDLLRRIAAAAKAMNKRKTKDVKIMRSALDTPRPMLDTRSPGWRHAESAYDFKAMQAEINTLKKENDHYREAVKEVLKQCTDNGFSSPKAAINSALRSELRIMDLERELRELTGAINSKAGANQIKELAGQAEFRLLDDSWKTQAVESKWVKWPPEENGA